MLPEQAQVHCSAIPSFTQTPAWQDTPCDPASRLARPREVGLSVLDEQAGPHVLCCGHMLHDSCLASHRCGHLESVVRTFKDHLAAFRMRISVLGPRCLACEASSCLCKLTVLVTSHPFCHMTECGHQHGSLSQQVCAE